MFDKLADVIPIVEIAIKAGDAIMTIYSKDFQVEHKADQSPLTAADKAGNDIIVQQLSLLYPQIPIISEENKLLDYSIRKDWNDCWVVDPLDGTKEFIKKNGEFTVNIALVRNGEPILGVVHVPAQNVTYYALKNAGSHKVDQSGEVQSLTIRPLAEDGTLRVVGSRSHNSPEVDTYVDGLKGRFQEVAFVAAGSSLKFCLVAEGNADVYPRFAPTMEWDTCAGQIVATEAGAEVLTYPELKPLQYNRPDLLNPFFIVRNPELV